MDLTKCCQLKQHQFESFFKEYHGSEVLFKPYGFMAYQILGEECHIFIAFVYKEYRGLKYSAELAKEIECIGHSKGCNTLVSHITLPSPCPDVSLQCQLNYGFKIDKIIENQIILKKRIENHE